MMAPAIIMGEGLAQTTAPTNKVLSEDEVKTQVRSIRTDETTYLARLVAAATQKVEHDTGLQLITATWVWKIGDFPAGGILFVPKNPLLTVTSVVYIDTAGDSQTLASSKYDLGLTSKRGRIALAYSEVWPTVRRQIDAVTITFTAGFGTSASDIPTDLLHACELLVAHWYEFREPILAGTIIASVPITYDALISHHRTQFF